MNWRSVKKLFYEIVNFVEKITLIIEAKKSFGSNYIFIPMDLDLFFLERYSPEDDKIESIRWKVNIFGKKVDYIIKKYKMSNRDFYLIPDALFN